MAYKIQVIDKQVLVLEEKQKLPSLSNINKSIYYFSNGGESTKSSSFESLQEAQRVAACISLAINN